MSLARWFFKKHRPSNATIGIDDKRIRGLKMAAQTMEHVSVNSRVIEAVIQRLEWAEIVATRRSHDFGCGNSNLDFTKPSLCTCGFSDDVASWEASKKEA